MFDSIAKPWCRWALFGVALAAAPAPAAAQSCPSEYSACDNGLCCLSSEQCCPMQEQGCCPSSTPFCCGDGTCAATPSQCASASRATCDGYDVPCGEGCAPAGSDCCDGLGHYCPPETMCTSDTTCVLGDTPSLARTVPVTSRPDPSAAARVAPPFRDPEDASDRSCGLSPGTARGPTAGWLLVASAMLWRRRRAAARRG